MPFGGALTMAGIGGGLSLINGGIQASQAAAERKRQAAMTRYSLWTGMAGHTVQDPNVFGGAVQGGASGAAMAQNIAKAEQQKKWADAMISHWGSSGNVDNSNAAIKDDVAMGNASKSQGLQNATTTPPLTGSAGALQGAGMGAIDPALAGGFSVDPSIALMSSAPAANGSLWDALSGLSAG